MDITTFLRGDTEIQVHVNMGTEISIFTSFPDVDDTTFRSDVHYLTIGDLERVLQIAKEAQERHNLIVGKDSYHA